jgi:uncharacterized membrane protein
MNKDKVSIITCLLIFFVAVAGLLFVNNAHVNKIVFAVGKKSKFNEDDFMWINTTKRECRVRVCLCNR